MVVSRRGGERHRQRERERQRETETERERERQRERERERERERRREECGSQPAGWSDGTSDDTRSHKSLAEYATCWHVLHVPAVERDSVRGARSCDLVCEQTGLAGLSEVCQRHTLM